MFGQHLCYSVLEILHSYPMLTYGSVKMQTMTQQLNFSISFCSTVKNSANYQVNLVNTGMFSMKNNCATVATSSRQFYLNCTFSPPCCLSSECFTDSSVQFTASLNVPFPLHLSLHKNDFFGNLISCFKRTFVYSIF